MQRSLLVLLYLLFLAGCSAGFNCPFDRPACCDNVVFGCGTFDLPDGCSCADYFSRNYTPYQKLSANLAADSKFNGNWRVTLTSKSNNCSYLSKSVTAFMTIQQKRSNLSVNIPGYGKLNGRMKGKLIAEVKDNSEPLFLGCIATSSATITKRNEKSASVNAKVYINCPSPILSCNATYSGIAAKT